MSQPVSRSLTPASASLPAKLVGIETRVDAAHATRLERGQVGTLPGEAHHAPVTAPPAAGVPLESAGPPTADPAGNWETQRQRLETQAEQLAAFLRQRQQELDRRDARYNAQVAEIENEARAARLWVAERHHELDERREALDERERALAARGAQLAEAEDQARQFADQRQKQLAEREIELDRRARQLDAAAQRTQLQSAALEEAQSSLVQQRERQENQLAAERQRVDARRAASLELVRQLHAGLERRQAAMESEWSRLEQLRGEATQQAEADHRQFQHRAAELTQRERALDDLSIRLGAEAATLAAAQQQLAVDRARLTAEQVEFQRHQALRREQLEAEWAEQCSTLDDQQSELAEREAQLNALTQELEQLHRETLEARLATEELWAQIVGDVSPVLWERTLKDVRRRLTARLRAAEEQIRRRQGELAEAEDQARRAVEQLRAEREAWQEEVRQGSASQPGIPPRPETTGRAHRGRSARTLDPRL